MTVAVLVDQLERTSSTTARDLLKRAINGVLGSFEVSTKSRVLPLVIRT